MKLDFVQEMILFKLRTFDALFKLVIDCVLVDDSLGETSSSWPVAFI